MFFFMVLFSLTSFTGLGFVLPVKTLVHDPGVFVIVFSGLKWYPGMSGMQDTYNITGWRNELRTFAGAGLCTLISEVENISIVVVIAADPPMQDRPSHSLPSASMFSYSCLVPPPPLPPQPLPQGRTTPHRRLLSTCLRLLLDSHLHQRY